MRIITARLKYGHKVPVELRQEIIDNSLRAPHPEFNEEGEAVAWYQDYFFDIDRLGLAALICLEDIKPAFSGLTKEIQDVRGAVTLNKIVQVAVPGNALLQITETRVFENACTVALQGELKDGWRIIAVCPQPDQRRPDYILGR